MAGELVAVRCFGDEMAVMRVWEDLGERVAVIAPDETVPVVPLGFERTDVFAFTREAEAMLGGPVDWKRLSPF